MKTVTLFLGLIVLLSVPASVLAIVASSSSFIIERDSVNFGGILSNSANYSLEDTGGEVGTGPSESSSFNLNAGYQQMDASTISITASGTIALSPALDESTAGVSDGQTGVRVTTNNSAGYRLYVQASTSPALASGSNTFTDYTPSGADPDFAFATPTADKVFGYSPEGADVVSTFKDNGTSCNTGSGNTTDACWQGLTTSPVNIASAGTLNSPNGTYTTVKLRAGVGSGATVGSGTYSASLIFSAVMQ